MSGDSNEWKSGSRVKHQTNIRSKSSFWSKDNYKSAKLKSNRNEREKLYTFDNNYYDQKDDIQDSDDNQFNQNSINKRSVIKSNCFELKNRNNYQNSYQNNYQNNELSCDEKNRQDFELTKSDSLIDYINYQIKESDSLQSIALRYGCSVSKIKQINHLMTDQEFYGLRVVKLPVKKFGILSDVLVHQVNNSSQLDSDHNSSNLIDIDFNELDLQKPRTNSLTVNIGISQHLNRTNSEDAFKFLNHMDEDLKKIRESTKTVIESSNVKNLVESTVRESDYSIFESTKLKNSAFFSCDESDYGINWFNLLLLAFVLLILVPFIYVLYISESHNNTISNVHYNH
jgi:LysM repeat protein